MTRVPLNIPAGLNGDDTAYAAAGRWADADKVRFYRQRPQVIGGWESLIATLLTGVCRGVFHWTNVAGSLNVAFGTHSNLEVWIGGALYDITPTKAFPAVTLAASPLATTNTSAVVTVTHRGHGLSTGDSIIVSGAAAVGGITPNGTFTITKIGTDSYSYVFSSAATSTATGGGSAVVITPQNAFASGAINGTGGAGYGTGAYSTGYYSAPSTSDYFPRTWSMGAWGENLLACARNGPIYAWTNATGTPAAPIANSPANVTHMVVMSASSGYQAFALGCNEEVSGVFNPVCIRHNGIRALTVWNTASDTTAQEYILPGGGRIVGGRAVGRYLLVWTNHSLFLGTYVGSPGQVWRFDRVGEKCGLIGPNAAVIVGQTAFWLGPDLQFYSYGLGGAVRPIECPIREALADNIAASQGDKVYASSTSTYNEVRFDYPDARDGVENSRYLTLIVDGPDAGAWSRGVMARSAYVDAGPAAYPIGVTPGGMIYYHERGKTADGDAFSWFIQTADTYIDDSRTSLVRGLWPDFADQSGPINVTVTSKLKPQDPTPRTVGPYAMAVGDQKTDLRISGRLFSVKISGNASPTSGRFGKLNFDLAVTGAR